MGIINKFKCFIGYHKCKVIDRNNQLYHLKCIHCGKEYAYHIGIGVSVPWKEYKNPFGIGEDNGEEC